MNSIFTKFLTILSIASISILNAQTQYATDVVVVNGENFGSNASNIGVYNIASKMYEVIDTMGTSSVQDVLIDSNIAFVSAQTKIFSYDLSSKTKIAEVDYPGASPSKGSLFTDDNHVFVGNWYGQTDSNFYAFDKTTLTYDFSVMEATSECGGGLSLNDTLYIGQKIKGTIDGCAPYGCFSDTLGTIIVANANTGEYYRTIDLGEAGKGVSQIYNEGNYIFAVCAGSNKILKVEIGTDIITEYTLAPFSKATDLIDTKLYLDLNSKVGYFDLTDGSFAMSALDMTGVALAYDPGTETAFTTSTDYSSFGKLNVYNATSQDTTIVGVSPEAIALIFVTNTIPVAIDDSYEFIYEQATSEYLLAVVNNDTDGDGDALSISNVTTPNVSGATATIDGQNIKYTRASGIATTDYFTYTVCDNTGACDDAIVHITLKSLTDIDKLNAENQVTIYPNPTSDYIYINTNRLLFEKVVITDATGHIVKISKETKINLESIDKGLYFAQVYTEKGIITIKFSVR